MTTINLLPWRQEARKEQARDFFIVSGFVLLTVILICFFIHLYFARVFKKELQANTYLTTEISELDVKILEVRDIKLKKSELMHRMQIIEYLQTNRSNLVKMFNQFVQMIPEGVYLTYLEKKADVIILRGQAESNSSISVFMKNLEQSPSFINTHLTEIVSNDKNNPNIRFFELQMESEHAPDEINPALSGSNSVQGAST
jgi:type IV pilus assembly protein PilN